MNNHKVGVLVSGRGSNLQAIMDKIAEGVLPLEIAVVISDKADAFALERAEKAGIPNFAVVRKECADKKEFEAKIDEILRAHGVELIVLAGFMRILGPDFISGWRHKIINIHPALLPSFGGKGMWGQHVHEAVLKAGCKVSGCTVHFCTNEYDAGPIIVQRCCPVMDGDDPEALAARVFKEECIAYPEAIGLFAAGKLTVRNGRVKRG